VLFNKVDVQDILRIMHRKINKSCPTA